MPDLHGADRPSTSLFTEGEAEAWAVRDPHTAVPGLQVLVEQRIEPVEVFDPGLGRIGRGKVTVDLHGEVRRDLQLPGRPVPRA